MKQGNDQNKSGYMVRFNEHYLDFIPLNVQLLNISELKNYPDNQIPG
jgi:hypothetical protein